MSCWKFAEVNSVPLSVLSSRHTRPVTLRCVLKARVVSFLEPMGVAQRKQLTTSWTNNTLVNTSTGLDSKLKTSATHRSSMLRAATLPLYWGGGLKICRETRVLISSLRLSREMLMARLRRAVWNLGVLGKPSSL